MSARKPSGTTLIQQDTELIRPFVTPHPNCRGKSVELPFHGKTHMKEYSGRLLKIEWSEMDFGKRHIKPRKFYDSIPLSEDDKLEMDTLDLRAAGTIFGSQINHLRELGRLTVEFEADEFAPVYASWDIGVADFMSVWLIQPGTDGKFYLLDNLTANGLTLDWYAAEIRKRETRDGYHIRDCLLPHDCENRVPGGTSFIASLERAGFSCIRVPCTTDRWASIDATRRLLRHAVIHARCSEKTFIPNVKEGYLSGVNALSNYRTAPPGRGGTLKTEPLHDVCSHASDALRTFSEAWEAGYISKQLGWRNDEHDPRSRDKSRARGVEELY